MIMMWGLVQLKQEITGNLFYLWELSFIYHTQMRINSFKYHVFAPMGRFQLELFTFIFHRRPIYYIYVSVL